MSAPETLPAVAPGATVRLVLGSDRAGNPRLVLVLDLPDGFDLRRVDGDGCRWVLDGPAAVACEVSDERLASMARAALWSRGGRCKAGPLTVRRAGRLAARKVPR